MLARVVASRLGLVALILPESVSCKLLQTTTLDRSHRPPYFWLRVMLLLMAAWISSVVVCTTASVVVLFTGRFLFNSCGLSAKLFHDPYAIVIGLVFWWKLLATLDYIIVSYKRFLNSYTRGHGQQLKRLTLVELVVKMIVLLLTVGIVPLIYIVLHYKFDSINLKLLPSRINSSISSFLMLIVVHLGIVMLFINRVFSTCGFMGQLGAFWRNLKTAYSQGFVKGSVGFWLTGLLFPLATWGCLCPIVTYSLWSIHCIALELFVSSEVTTRWSFELCCALTFIGTFSFDFCCPR